jgi:hypothetical protein
MVPPSRAEVVVIFVAVGEPTVGTEFDAQLDPFQVVFIAQLVVTVTWSKSKELL